MRQSDCAGPVKTGKSSCIRVIGVTGGVGAGKSTVLDYLKERYGAAVLEADRIGHEVMEPGRECYEAVVSLFGAEVVGKDGFPDRGKIAAAVYADPELLEELDRIIHPAVKRVIESRIAEYGEGADTFGLVVVEAALLVEGGLDGLCDEIWYVFAPVEVRVQRLMRSRGYSRERCEEIMKNQAPDAVFRKRADVVIDNGGTAEETRRQVEKAMAQAAAF